MIASRLAMLALAGTLAGCVAAPHRQAPFASWSQDPDTRVATCVSLFADFDEGVRQTGIADGGPVRVPGYPFLRADRTIVALAQSSASDGDTLLRAMRRLDATGRGYEAMNLPAERRERLSARLASETLDEALRRCGDLLFERADKAALRAAEFPRDYSVGKRVAGAYWLTRVPFSSGVRRYQRETARTFALPVDALPVLGELRRYGASSEVSGSLSQDALRFGEVPDPAALRPWFEHFAPILEIDTAAEQDRIGHPRRRVDGAAAVDVSQPVMFVRLSHALVRGELWPQLVYSVWFPSRPKQGALDLLGGALDGITWRVTIGPDGMPWLFDTMHNCGCYHQFFPTPHLTPRVSPGGLDEWAFVPQRLPALVPGDRVTLRIAASTHYLQRVVVSRDGEAGTSVSFADDESLRSLADEAGVRRSLFGADGIVRGSERGERWLFWPMGIAEPGAMRQWGRHATAFVGRRHFDDVDLIARYFDVAETTSR